MLREHIRTDISSEFFCPSRVILRTQYWGMSKVGAQNKNLLINGDTQICKNKLFFSALTLGGIKKQKDCFLRFVKLRAFTWVWDLDKFHQKSYQKFSLKWSQVEIQVPGRNNPKYFLQQNTLKLGLNRLFQKFHITQIRFKKRKNY